MLESAEQMAGSVTLQFAEWSVANGMALNDVTSTNPDGTTNNCRSTLDLTLILNPKP